MDYIIHLTDLSVEGLFDHDQISAKHDENENWKPEKYKNDELIASVGLPHLNAIWAISRDNFSNNGSNVFTVDLSTRKKRYLGGGNTTKSYA